MGVRCESLNSREVSLVLLGEFAGNFPCFKKKKKMLLKGRCLPGGILLQTYLGGVAREAAGCCVCTAYHHGLQKHSCGENSCIAGCQKSYLHCRSLLKDTKEPGRKTTFSFNVSLATPTEKA